MRPCAVGPGSPYRRREPEATLVHEVVRNHLETFLAQSRGDPDSPGPPRFVERELRAYLDCGILARGFLRVRCEGCGDDLLVAFSCKVRTVCPSCAGRRMHETAAFLAARVLPDVPYRQWVMSFPRWVRLHLALDTKLITRALGIVLRTLFAWQRKKARALGWRRSRTAVVTFVQRFSSALRLNVHFHCLVLDGVFAIEPDPTTARSRFLRLPAPTDDEVEAINIKAARKVIAALRAEDCDVDVGSAGTGALGVTYAAALQPPLRGFTSEPARRGRRCSNVDGFSLHANVHVPAGDRARLERLCRYGLRPPFALDRFERLPSGSIAYRMKRPAPDGATHRVMTPFDLVGELAGPLAPPRAHLVRYHGAFAPHARDRATVVPAPPPSETTSRSRISHRLEWAELLKRVFAVDVFACDKCGARRRVLAAITDPRVVRQILTHLGLSPRAPPTAPARRPPQRSIGFDPGGHL